MSEKIDPRSIAAYTGVDEGDVVAVLGALSPERLSRADVSWPEDHRREDVVRVDSGPEAIDEGDRCERCEEVVPVGNRVRLVGTPGRVYRAEVCGLYRGGAGP